MSKIQDSDVKNQTEAGSASRLINDTKIYVSALGLNKRLDSAITDGDFASALDNIVSTSSTPYNSTTSNDIILMDASGGAKTVNLFAASGNSGRHLFIRKTDSSFNAVTIDGNASETIDGSTTTTLDTQNESLHLVCDGSNWHIIDRKIPSYWTSYTLSITASGSNPTKATTPVTDSAHWMRSGPNLILKYSYYQGAGSSGAGSGSGEYRYAIPSGLSINTTVLVGTGGEVNLGDAFIQYAGIAYLGWVTYRGVSGNIALAGSNAGTGFFSGSGTTPMNSTNDVIYAFTATVPISGWNG